MSEHEIDELSGVQTTGHEWDGIKELDNPMPAWWLYTFYASIVFSVIYMVVYPAIPLWNAATPGILGETNRSELKAELRAVNDAKAAIEAKIAASDLEAIRSDAELSRYARAGGASLYKVFCTQCHGSGAQGGAGFPNLNDDDWIWGGDIDTIYATISHGVRNEDDADARFSEMPAFGAGILNADDIRKAANYVASLSGLEHDEALAGEGAGLFADNCASCHGDDGRGMRDLGAPNLADALWLYGGSVDRIAAQIATPKHGVMPAWLGRLGEAKVKQLAVYIHSLGGGEQAKKE